MERERRFIPIASGEVRAKAGRKGIRGSAILADTVTDLSGFTEDIAPEAITDAINQGWDIRGLFNHSPDFPLGRTKSGTMTVSATAGGKSFDYDIPQMPRSRGDVMEAIERGDVSGNSFSFSVPADGETWNEDGAKPHRRITRFSMIYDLGPVTFPAYEDTTVSTRAEHRARQFTTGRGGHRHQLAPRGRRLLRLRQMRRDIGPTRPPKPAPGAYGTISRELGVHEASHAIVALFTGTPVRGLRFDYAWKGEREGWHLTGAHCDMAPDSLAALVAGRIGRALYDGAPRTSSFQDVASAVDWRIGSDYWRAWHGFGTVGADWNAAIIKARDILVREWCAVEALTDLAVERGELSATDVRRCVLRHASYEGAKELRNRWYMR
jgi:HK97 family phage prohead protease